MHQLKEMRPTHDGILDIILLNPQIKLRELAAATGYSVSWLSQMTRSDLFRAAYDARRGDIECEVMMGVGERLNALSHLAIDKMEKRLKETEDADFVIDAFDKVLHRTGYAPNSTKTQGPAAPTNQQNNFFLVEKGELSQLRERIVQNTPLPLPAPEGDSGTNTD